MKAAFFWPEDLAETALSEVASHLGLEISRSRDRGDGKTTERLVAHAERIGIDLTVCHIEYASAAARLRSIGPALASVVVDGERGLVAILGYRRGRFKLGRRDGDVEWVSSRRLMALVLAPLESEIELGLVSGHEGDVLDDPAIRRALVLARCRDRHLGPFYIVDSGAATHDVLPLRRDALRSFLAFVVASFVHSVCWVLAFWFLGTAALRGRIDPHLWSAFVFALVSLVVVRSAATWFEGRCGRNLGLWVRALAIRGALALNPQLVRRKGVGQLMGRAIEVESLEQLAISGGLASTTGSIDVLMAAVVFAMAGAGRWLVLIWLAALAATVFACRRYYRAYAAWTDSRLALTHDLVDKLVGHRTRLIQLPPDQWNTGEDIALKQYISHSHALDVVDAMIAAMIPRAFAIVGLLSVGILLLAGATTVELAVAIGGVLLGWRGLAVFGRGVAALVAAYHAGGRASELLRPPRPAMSLPVDLSASNDGDTLIELSKASYTYPGRATAAVSDAHAVIRHGDHILLRGSSGSGKSTVASMLTGEIEPTTGVALLQKIDRGSLGFRMWRQRSVLVPQFHQNHVFAETLAFNIFLGGAWPPTMDELREAETLLRELELGPLLDRMPSGMFTRVGDSGWQLSHGEQSRLFVARALMQKADVVVFDESLAALDPKTLETCMAAIRSHATSLVLIAHP